MGSNSPPGIEPASPALEGTFLTTRECPRPFPEVPDALNGDLHHRGERMQPGALRAEFYPGTQWDNAIQALQRL